MKNTSNISFSPKRNSKHSSFTQIIQIIQSGGDVFFVTNYRLRQWWTSWFGLLLKIEGLEKMYTDEDLVIFCHFVTKCLFKVSFGALPA